MPVLQVDCRFTVVEAMLRGYLKWKTVNADDSVGTIFLLKKTWLTRS